MVILPVIPYYSDAVIGTIWLSRNSQERLLFEDPRGRYHILHRSTSSWLFLIFLMGDA